MVVHGEPGIDELSPCGATTVATVRDGSVTISELDARELGVERCSLSDLAGGDPQRNAEITLAVLGGEDGPAADATALNAAAALVVAGPRGRSRRGAGSGARGAAQRCGHGDVADAARRPGRT